MPNVQQQDSKNPALKARIALTLIIVILAVMGLEMYWSYESQFLSQMAAKQLEDSQTGYAIFRFFSRNTIPNLIYAALAIGTVFIWVPFFRKSRKEAQNTPAEN